MAAFSGCITSVSPMDVSVGNGATGTSVIAASITTTEDNTMRVVGMGNINGTDVTAGSSGMTQGAEQDGCELWYDIQASAGSSGTITFGGTMESNGH